MNIGSCTELFLLLSQTFKVFHQGNTLEDVTPKTSFLWKAVMITELKFMLDLKIDKA